MAGSKTISTSQTRIEALRLQSSAYGVTVQVVYGVNRIAGNLIWYGGFKAIPHTSTQSSGGKAGGVKIQNTDYTYTASVMMGLCHGKITGIPRLWKGKSLYSGGIAPGQLNTTTENTSVAAGGGFFNVSHASNYSGSIRVTTTVTNEFGTSVTTLREGTDYTVAGGHYTFYDTDAFISGANVSVTYQYTGAGVSQNALTQVGLGLTTGELGQAAWSALTTLAPSQAIGYSGLAYVSAQDYDLGTGAQVDNHQFEVQGFMAYSVSSNTPDVDPSDFVSDILTNTRYGASFDGNHLASVENWSNYCRASGLLMSPALTEQQSASDLISQAANLTNTAVVWSGDRIKFVPYGDANLSGNGRSYTPNTTPLYDLSDDNFLDHENPVVIETSAQSNRYNHIRIEWTNRGSWNASTSTFDGQYGYEIMEAKDQADIETNGLRSADVLPAHWICDANVARSVAQLLLQRSINVVNTYTFRLPWSYALLEPMDLVTLTDIDQGLNKTAVRITSVEEDDEGTLTFTAEDYPIGVASATLYPNASGNGFSHDFNAQPGNVVTPVFIEAPPDLTTTGLAVWAAVTGTDPNWGGCYVWVSTDGNTYKQVDTLYGGSRYGYITGPVSANVVPVHIYTGELLNASFNDAVSLASLCFIGGNVPEYVSYEGTTLTGNGSYNVDLIERGAYDTSGASNHSTNDSFVRVDQTTLAKSGDLNTSLIGTTLHFKFTSFNIYGGAAQALSDVTSFTYTITGYMACQPAPDLTNFALTVVPGGLLFYWDPSPDVSDETELHLESAWNNSTSPTFRGTATQYLQPWPANGSHTMLAKHRRAVTGTYSNASASITYNVSGTNVTIGASTFNFSIDTPQIKQGAVNDQGVADVDSGTQSLSNTPSFSYNTVINTGLQASNGGITVSINGYHRVRIDSGGPDTIDVTGCMTTGIATIDASATRPIKLTLSVPKAVSGQDFYVPINGFWSTTMNTTANVNPSVEMIFVSSNSATFREHQLVVEAAALNRKV